MNVEEYFLNFSPEFKTENRVKWNEVREDMFVHTRGKVPEKLLETRRPNEDKEVFDYSVSIYEPITKGAMNKAIDRLFRMFQGANYSIKVSEGLDNYLSEAKFNGDYFINFIQKKILRTMIEDPNGVLAWIPSGEGLENPSVKVEVLPVVVSSSSITFLNKDRSFITWKAENESSEVVIGQNKTTKQGEVFYSLSKEGFYKTIQVGKKIEKRFETFLIYEHNIGIAPFVILGGNLTSEDYFESFFSPFIPFGNETIRQFSDWQGVMTTSAFPYREEVAETCSAKGCRKGFVFDKVKETETTCKACKGTGLVMNRSPYGAFIRSKGSSLFDGEKGSSEPLVRFISPPVEIIKHSGEAWEKLLSKAEDALNLLFVDEAQSGKAKEIDREDADSMLTKISNNVFDEIIFNSLRFIEKYREIEGSIDPIVVKPISFRIKTEESLIDELNQLSDKNAPIAFQVEATKDLARKRFSGNTSIARIVEVLVAFDPIFNVKTSDKQILLASGTIKKSDIIKSLYSYKVLTELVAENGTEFLEKPLKEIFATLDAELVKYFDNAPSISIEDEQKLESQSKIRGSVGGVQGIIEINKAVAEGSMSEQAGETILESIYGIDLNTAQKMVEKGQVQPVVE